MSTGTHGNHCLEQDSNLMEDRCSAPLGQAAEADAQLRHDECSAASQRSDVRVPREVPEGLRNRPSTVQEQKWGVHHSLR